MSGSDRGDAARGDAHRVLGLDLGGTNIKWTVLQVRAGDEVESIASGWEPTHADGGPEVVTERLLVAGRTAITAHGPIAAAGVGVPGLFDAATGADRAVPEPAWPVARLPLARASGSRARAARRDRE